MSLRRLLLIAIGALSLAILAAGVGVAGLLIYRFGRPVEQQLLVINDGSLSLLGPDGKSRVLAEDANRDFRYPSLSPDGSRLAYISVDAGEASISVLRLSDGTRTELFRSSDSQPFYMTWSPDGKHISFLSGQSDGQLAVRIVAADGSAAADLVSTAANSSYFAWRPDSSALLLHSDGAVFEDGRVTAYTPGTERPLLERADPGIFNTPAWSTDGSRIFYVAQPALQGQPSAEEIESVLTGVAADGSAEALASEKRAAMLFARAPSSDDIAYITVNNDGFGPLKLVAAAGGPPRLISRESEGTLGFFWSPDGKQIAYITLEAPVGGAAQLSWHVVDLTDGQIRDLASFTPSRAFLALLSYFDAYAFSFSLWSPRGDQLVYGAEDGVYVLNIASGEAERRADGAMATWVARR